MSTRLLQIFKDPCIGHSLSNVLANHVFIDRCTDKQSFIYTNGRMSLSPKEEGNEKKTTTIWINPEDIMLMK